MGRFRRWWHRDGAESGATGVEYALITALLLVSSLGAIKALERNADDYYDTTSTRIGALPSIDGAAPTGTSIPGASSTTTIATTTTTAAPTTTTAAPTTTTTAAPTTTTAAPTTTTTVAPRSYISATSDSSDTTGNNAWRPAITVTVKNTSTGAVISGASVTVTFTRTSGTLINTASCTTTTSGTCLARISGVADSITSVIATVTGVTSTPTWNGATASRTLAHP